MARGKHKGKHESSSLRDQIKAYRRNLHGEVAEAFDNTFCEMSGASPVKKALSEGRDLQKAFVAAKVSADAMRKQHPIVEVPDLPSEDE